MKLRPAIQRFVQKMGLHVEPFHDGKLRWNQSVILNFPVELQPRWGYGLPVNSHIHNVLSSNSSQYETILNDLATHSEYFASISESSTDITEPVWDNPWFSGLDAAVLSRVLISRRPKLYLEVGSGFSTKFARQAVRRFQLSTNITSVDPQPRTEIDAICDRVVRSRLESCELTLFDAAEPGDIIFFDGSHRVLQNSDTVVFFLEVIPRLKPGVLVHVHDIFLPHDYPPNWARRVYSEQYLLASMILSGAEKFRILFPGYFVSIEPKLKELAQEIFAPRGQKPHLLEKYGTQAVRPSSFWFEIAKPLAEPTKLTELG